MFRGPFFLECAWRRVSASPRAARAPRVQRGPSMGTINYVSLLLFIIAKLCYVCVVMHCVVPVARLPHVRSHILVLATNDSSCGLKRSGRRMLVLILTAAHSKLGQPTLSFNDYLYLLMPVVTLQSLKMIGRLEVGKLGHGPQILQVLNVFMRQMEPHVKWHFSGRKLYFRFLMFQNGSKNQYLGFQLWRFFRHVADSFALMSYTSALRRSCDTVQQAISCSTFHLI